MTEQTAQSDAAAPRFAPGALTPTPTPHELNLFVTQQMTGTLPLAPWCHAMDGSPIDMTSKDPTAKTTSWP